MLSLRELVVDVKHKRQASRPLSHLSCLRNCCLPWSCLPTHSIRRQHQRHNSINSAREVYGGCSESLLCLHSLKEPFVDTLWYIIRKPVEIIALEMVRGWEGGNWEQNNYKALCSHSTTLRCPDKRDTIKTMMVEQPWSKQMNGFFFAGGQS